MEETTPGRRKGALEWRSIFLSFEFNESLKRSARTVTNVTSAGAEMTSLSPAGRQDTAGWRKPPPASLFSLCHYNFQTALVCPRLRGLPCFSLMCRTMGFSLRPLQQTMKDQGMLRRDLVAETHPEAAGDSRIFQVTM